MVNLGKKGNETKKKIIIIEKKKKNMCQFFINKHLSFIKGI